MSERHRLRDSTSGVLADLRTAPGRLRHLWRASLGFRVVAVTMLLGVVVLSVVGTYLYGSIAQGLVDSRQRLAADDSLVDARAAQERFDAAGWTDAESLKQLARDVVTRYAEGEGRSERRYVVLTPTDRNDLPVTIEPIESSSGVIRFVPTTLNEAIEAAPDRQHLQLTTMVEADGTEISTVVVGQRVEVPVAGSYDLYFLYPMERERGIIELIGRTFLIGGLALVLLIGAVAFVVTRLVADPVRRAAAVAERFAGGNLNERMRARGEDELARLGNSFNAMAASIQQQIGQLENLSRVQQRFVSDVSHELRTPLTTIRMAADLIHDAKDSFEPTVRRSAELLQHELDRFELLLSDLLEISRFDAGAAELELEATDLRASVERVVEAHATLARTKGSQIRVVGSDEPVVAEVDHRRIERILRNLVSNAIEHGEGRPIEVHLGINDSAVAVAVRDHGVGLRPGEAALVFTRFWRADPARARTTGGTGLGLAISLEDARLHSGRLEAWGAPGIGSSFRLTVPRQAGGTIAASPLPLSPLSLGGTPRPAVAHGFPSGRARETARDAADAEARTAPATSRPLP